MTQNQRPAKILWRHSQFAIDRNQRDVSRHVQEYIGTEDAV